MSTQASLWYVLLYGNGSAKQVGHRCACLCCIYGPKPGIPYESFRADVDKLSLPIQYSSDSFFITLLSNKLSQYAHLHIFTLLIHHKAVSGLS